MTRLLLILLIVPDSIFKYTTGVLAARCALRRSYHLRASAIRRIGYSASQRPEAPQGSTRPECSTGSPTSSARMVPPYFEATSRPNK